jgi:glycosyltransferase involved in cell wall biosynthesis
MRVLHVVEATIAGVRTHVQTLSTGLDRRRFQSVVACPPHRENAYGDDQFVNYLTNAGIPVVPVAMRRSISPLADLVGLHRLVDILRRQRFDVVHLHSSKAGLLGRLAARIASGPAVVYTPNGLAFLGDHGPKQRYLYLQMERLAARWCDRIIAVSPGERNLIVSSGIASPDRVVCIDMGIDPDIVPRSFDRSAQRRALGLPLEAIVIGTAARVEPQKNPLLLVEAAAQVLKAAPNTHFIWCGDGQLRATVEARAQALGIAGHCRFLGHREDARLVLAACDLFWLTSNYESFGLATVEAMALELPVVATDVLGTCDVVVPGVTGMLVPPRDPAALACATIDLLGALDRRLALGQAGRGRVLERYTRDHMLKATALFYETLLAARGTATDDKAASSSFV